MVNGLSVLVLNQNYQALNICRLRRAVLLLLMDKAEMVENGVGEIRTPTAIFPIPSIIRLHMLVRRPPVVKRLTRFEVFNRDHYACQYCGRETRELTLDHVIPRHQGGGHEWENVVSACIPCNHKKAGKTPREAGMRLHQRPYAPPSFFTVPYQYLRANQQWLKFLPQ